MACPKIHSRQSCKRAAHATTMSSANKMTVAGSTGSCRLFSGVAAKIFSILGGRARQRLRIKCRITNKFLPSSIGETSMGFLCGCGADDLSTPLQFYAKGHPV